MIMFIYEMLILRKNKIKEQNSDEGNIESSKIFYLSKLDF
jgi:hypothetical protein